ncbi:MAG: type IV-A pilus assembly ATPase PilB [Legionellaceae bacterium]|nr:type IV-A pilus assembly ATPase PilB [Legionellaceae bacterium]
MEVHLQGAAQPLVQQKLLTAEEALHYQDAAMRLSLRFVPYLVTHNILTARTIAVALASHFNLSFIDLNEVKDTMLADNSFHETWVNQHHVLPLFCRGNQLYVAVDDPSQHTALHDVQFHTGLPITPMVAETTQLTERINQLLYKKEHQGLTHYFAELPIISAFEPLIATEDDAPVVKFVNRIIHQAIEKGASDIHFEPYENYYRIRYRQDGLLHDIAEPPQNLATRIASRLKIMSNLDISERRMPQDGRFTIQQPNKAAVDCRVSTCPTVSGEKIVVRLLNTGFITEPDLELLSFSPRDKACFIQALSRPQGLILVTGPTGSGKSLTLYTALNRLNSGEKNISTAEDPVEMTLRGINQVQTNIKIGLTFATILRSFLRQDPDVIMIGEIRDLETAEIAIKASQTGHLVLSTLHTNSAAETLTRLVNIGIPAFHIVNAIRLIIAQRLVRRLCEHCKSVRDDVTPQHLSELGCTQPIKTNAVLYKAQGCPHCTQGYRGRIALFEVMPMSSHIEKIMMTPERKIMDIVQQAQSDGMHTIQQTGFTYVLEGVTSFEEINRVT